MTWRERRIVTILTAIALVLAAALLIVLGIRFRQWRAASESGAAVGADGTGTAADPAAGCLGSRMNLFAMDLGPSGPPPRIVPGILEEECAALLRDFFQQRR